MRLLLLMAAILPAGVFAAQGASLPVHEAARRGDAATLEKLLQAEPKQLSLKDREGRTPLLLASMFGSAAAVEVLLGRGADPKTSDEDGYTALHYACKRDETRMVDLLVRRGASVAAASRTIRETPLHWACARAGLAVVKLLVERGADVRCRDSYDRTPLHGAAGRAGTDILDYLIERGADIRARTRQGETPLHTAVNYARARAVEKLLAAGAFPGDRGEARELLNLATARGSPGTLDRLLDTRGARVVPEGELLHVAVDGAKTVRATGKLAGWTPHTQVIQLLLDRGCEVDYRDGLGRTPLNLLLRRWKAVGEGNRNAQAARDALSALLKAGADVDLADAQGVTPRVLMGELKIAVP